MRDFRDARAMARTLRQLLAAKGVKVTHAEVLEAVAKMLGERDWNTLAAVIAAAPAATPPSGAPPAPSAPSPRPGADRATRPGGMHFAPALEATLHRAVAAATQRRHEYVSLEHLLLVLVDDLDAGAVLQACAVDLAALKERLLGYVDIDLMRLFKETGAEPMPTAGFHRVIQRAVIHVQSAGRPEVTGANVLVAMFSERESYACALLLWAGIDRRAAIDFVAHGVRKDGGRAA